MPTPENIAKVYDFSNVFEVALKTLFTSGPTQVKAFTSQMIPTTGDASQDAQLQQQGYEIIDFIKDRPRVEIFFTPGAGQERHEAQNIGGFDTSVETSWKGQFRLDCTTDADIRQHSAFVTMVRYVMHTQLYNGINGKILQNHYIHQFAKDSGTTPMIKTEEGLFQTTLLFNIDFSIQEGAWALLVA